MVKGLSVACLMVILFIGGCAAPRCVPKDAKLVGGGFSESLVFPQAGRLYVVDAHTNSIVETRDVAGHKEVRFDMQQQIAKLLLTRYGAQGMAIFQQVGRAASGSLKPEETDALPDEPMVLEYYFSEAPPLDR